LRALIDRRFDAAAENGLTMRFRRTIESVPAPRILVLILGLVLAPAAPGQELRWPQEAPGDWLLAFVDVETTGLVPGYHEMIDIGIVMTDLEGAELAELFVRIQPEHPERTDAGARAVNAFDSLRWRELGALSAEQAIERLSEFHAANAGDRKVLMVAFNSQFDAAFLDHLFRNQGRSWRELYHYFVLDLPSMAWSLGLRGLTGSSLAATLGVADEPHVAELHTGITGARLNARIYRALLEKTATE
jgi:DNA polymerase III alpha subunit (gram-positive type)